MEAALEGSTGGAVPTVAADACNIIESFVVDCGTEYKQQEKWVNEALSMLPHLATCCESVKESSVLLSLSTTGPEAARSGAMLGMFQEDRHLVRLACACQGWA